MKNNIIFCDVDGTLIDGFNGLFDISNNTSESIKKVKESAYFIVASGRSKCMLPKGLLACCPDGFILNNGAYVEFNQKVLKNDNFNSQALDEIIEYNQHSENTYMFINQNNIYFKEKNDVRCIDLLTNLGVAKETFKHHLDDKYNFAVEICKDEFECQRFVEIFKNKFKLNRQYKYYAYDINLVGDSKGEAIKLIYDALGNYDFKSYCFGDSQNDIEMFHKCDVSIAMGNAKDEIIDIADIVTDSVLDDGFSKAIAKIFKI